MQITAGSDVGREHFCQTCGKLFNGRNWKQNLEYHTFKHTGLKPFKCPFCRHCSALKFNLLRHIKNKHANCLSVDANTDQFEFSSQLLAESESSARCISSSVNFENCGSLAAHAAVPLQFAKTCNNLNLSRSVPSTEYIQSGCSSSGSLQEVATSISVGNKLCTQMQTFGSLHQLMNTSQPLLSSRLPSTPQVDLPNVEHLNKSDCVIDDTCLAATEIDSKPSATTQDVFVQPF